MKTIKAICFFYCILCSVQHVSAQTTSMSFINPTQPKVANFDKVSTVETGWYWLTGVSATAISNKINEGFRIHDLEVESTQPLRFSAVFVKNTGNYQSGFWWYYGQTSNQIKNHISSKRARIIDLEIYYVNGQKRYAVVMVPNTGINTKRWWYYSRLTATQIKNKIDENRARLIDLDTYVHNNRKYYSTVMVANSGTDRVSWWYYYGLNAEQVRQKLQQNNARLSDIEFDGNKFTVVMERNPARWYYYHGLTMSRVNELVREKNARLTDVHAYRVDGRKRFAAIMVGAANTSANPTGGTTPDPNQDFPGLPSYITLSNSRRIVVDFSTFVDGHPRITLPVSALPALPYYEDEIVFPNNFCGLRVFLAERFVWLNQQGQPVQEFPYNFMPESQSILDLENGDTYYLGGIEFTGPIGACHDSNDPWQFPTPFTQTGRNPFPNLRLVIELVDQDARIEFLNYNVTPQHTLSPHNLFEENTFENIRNLFLEAGYGGFEEYMESVCATQPVFCED